MVCDVDEQVLLKEALDSSLGGDGWDDLHGGWSDVDVGDENTSMKVSTGEGLREGTHLLDADVGVSEEFDVDGADIWLRWVWHLVGRWGSVFLNHFLRWTSGLDHLLATSKQLAWAVRRL